MDKDNNNILTITGSNLEIFAYGRAVLRRYNTAQLLFVLTQKSDTDLQEKLLNLALQKILTTTRFGRIGLLMDRKNLDAKTMLRALDVQQFDYNPSDKRAMTSPEIHEFEYQVLREMAREGFADSVEFRRLARKFLRSAKHANCDSIVLLDSIMGDEIARKQWQSLAGTQRKIFCLSDFILAVPEIAVVTATWKDVPKRSIMIELDETWSEQKEFVYARAQKILRTKLAQTT